jgi:hypothetical protein
MKKTLTSVFCLTMIMTIAFSFAFSGLRAQSCEYFIKNDTILDAKHIQFDIYVKAKGETFYYGLAQYKIEYNAALANGGTLTVNINQGVSDLSNNVQIPKSVLQPNGKGSNFRINPSSIPKKQTSCSMISNKGLGTRICRVVIENTTNFAKVPANLHFVVDGPGATAVFYMSEKDLLVITK